MKRKKILALLLAGCMALQGGVTALAEDIIVEAEGDAVDMGEAAADDIAADAVTEESVEVVIDEAEDEAASETEYLQAEEDEVFDDGLAVLSIEPSEDPLLSEDGNPEAYADLPSSKYGTELQGGSCDEESEDTLRWTLYDNNADGTADLLVISGKGAMKDYASNGEAKPWETAPEGVQLILEEGITEITQGAFGNRGCTGELKLPSTLKKIGTHAFEGCAFTGTLTIPGTVELGEGAFRGVLQSEKSDPPKRSAENRKRGICALQRTGKNRISRRTYRNRRTGIYGLQCSAGRSGDSGIGKENWSICVYWIEPEKSDGSESEL